MGSLNANGVRCVFIFHFRKTIYIYNVHFIMQMVLPTILKRRHSLEGVKLLQAIKKIKLGQPESLKEYARIQKDIKTDELTLEDIGVHVKELTCEFKSCVILLLNVIPYLVLITKAFV
jgi:hypothetical protein